MSLANSNLEPGRKALVKRLPESRLQVERWFKIKDKQLGEESDLTLKLFGGYGLLDGTAAATLPAGDTHEVYTERQFANCRLVEERTEEVFLPGGETIHQLYQRYETLTDQWSDEDEDKESSTENGLRTLERVQVAIPGTAAPYDEDNVGVSNITDAGKTLYLAGFKDDSDDRRGRFIARWAEAGILNVRTPLVGGQQQVVVQAIGLADTAVATALSEVTSDHILIDESKGKYEGFQTIDYTFEVDDFEIWSETENGIEQLERRELGIAAFSRGAVGSSVYKGLTLVSEQIDNYNTIKSRTSRWSEAGIISIRPINNEGGFSLVQQYVYTSVGLTPEALHASTPLTKPSGAALATTAPIFFEPEVTNFKGFPTYTQILTDTAFPVAETSIKVHSKDGFFQVTDPGVMGCGAQTAAGDKSGAAVVFPQAESIPETYRKKATIEVYLTTDSTISETEVAYQDEGVQWAQQAIYSTYFNEATGAASGRGGWRVWPKYLKDALGDTTAFAQEAGVYTASAYAYKTGDTTYTTTGIYRVIGPKEYYKSADGTQYYLKTIITF